MLSWKIKVTVPTGTDFITKVQSCTSGRAIAHVARRCSEQGIAAWKIEIVENDKDEVL